MTRIDAWIGAALPLAGVALLALATLQGRVVRHARVTREGGTALLSEHIMHRGYAWIERLAAMAAGAGLSPNAVSWLSLALGLGAGVLAGLGSLGSAAWLLALSGLGDGVDGALARRSGVANPAGAVLDSALDRYVEFFFYAGLVWYFHDVPACQLVLITALFGGFMVTYSTAKAEALQLTPPRGWMKRPERMVWLTAGAAFAAMAPLVRVPSAAVLISVAVVIALFANASAIIRLHALAAAAAQKR
jgi:phosphatidylglycerophosphate synthase